jgi:hypothetical protein
MEKIFIAGGEAALHDGYSRNGAALLTDFRFLESDRLAVEDALQRREQGMTLLARRREIAPHAAEVACPVLSSKAARDLPLEFDHPQVTF